MTQRRKQRRWSEYVTPDRAPYLEELLTFSRQKGFVPTFEEAQTFHKQGLIPDPNFYAVNFESFDWVRKQIQCKLNQDERNETTEEPEKIATKSDDKDDDVWQNPESSIIPSQ